MKTIIVPNSKPVEDYERDYFRERFMLEYERRNKVKEFQHDKKRLKKVENNIVKMELKEC